MTAAPSAGPITVALLAASAAAPLPFGLAIFARSPDQFWAIPIILIFGFPVALLHAIVLALPAYLVARRRWRLAWWHAAIAGFIVGAVPSALLLSGDLDSSVLTGACGTFGGWAFWLTLRRMSDPVESPSLRDTFD